MLTTTTPTETADTAPRRYWALASNPMKYNIASAVQELKSDTWTTKGSQMRRGDRVVIWKTRGQGQDHERGIIAFGEVTSDPELRSDHENPYWNTSYRPAPDQFEMRAQVRYVHSPGLPLWMDDHSHDLLSQLSVTRAQGGTVFKITPELWNLLLERIGGWPEESEEAPEITDIRVAIEIAAGRSHTGQGFLLSAVKRRAIELHAMERAVGHYRALGWDVEDVSARESYDLRCRGEGIELHVEVKGTTGDGSQVLLTPNEVNLAEKASTSLSLFVVAGVILATDPNGPVQVTGGNAIILEPWIINTGTLLPLGFAYTLPSGGRG